MSDYLAKPCAIAFAAALFCSTGVVSLCGQSPGFADNEAYVDPNAVEDTLATLIEATSSLRNQTTALEETDDEMTLVPTDRRLDSRPVLIPPTTTPRVSRTRAPAEMEEIRKRIKLLKQLRVRSAGQSNDENTTTTPPSEQALPPSSLLLPPRRESPPTDQSIAAIEESLQHEIETTVQVSGPQANVQQIQSKRIHDAPIDKMRLGESLYRTQNFPAALQALKSVDVKTLDKSELAWRDLLLALCHRRTGDITSSEAILRDLANAKGLDFSGSMARWWLKQTTMTEEMRPTLEAIDKEIDTLIEKAQRYANQ